MSTNVLYGETERRVYPLSVIYDPDVDLPSSLESEAKIIPAVSSIVVDDMSGLHNTVYVVVAVDSETLKSTLRPAAFAEINDQTVDRILSYGNNIYMLYYSPVTITDDTNTTIKCNRLSIDDKFTLFGNHSANYQLVRTNADGTKTIISQTVVDAISVNNAGVSLANGVFKRTDSNAVGTDRSWIRTGKNIKIKYNSDTNKWELVKLDTNVVYYTANYDEAKEPWELEWTATTSTYGSVPNMSHVVSPGGIYGSVAETVVGSGIRKCIGCYSYADFEVVENNGSYEIAMNNPHVEYVDLSANNREFRLTTSYKQSVGISTDCGVEFMYRLNPNNIDTFGNESVFMFKIRHSLGI